MRLSAVAGPPLSIAAAVAWLPPDRSSAADAVASGQLDAETARTLGYRQLAVSPERSGPELAVCAAREALAAARWQGTGLALVAHAWTYHQGHDFWAPAHYVAHQVDAHNTDAIGVQQMCNGGVAALEIAVTRMIADPTATRCLVTTGDQFAEPGFDRWSSDVDVAYGDAGTAVLLERADGPHRLLSVVSAGAPRYELMHRGDDKFGAMPGWHSDVIDVSRTKSAFIHSGAVAEFLSQQHILIRRVLIEAVAAAGLAPGDSRVRYVVLPRIGAEALAGRYPAPIEEAGLGAAELLDPGRDTGHLGAGDAAASIAHVLSGGHLESGEVALVLNVGGGFTWSCTAVGAA